MTQTKNIMPKHYQQLQSFERGAAYYREQRAAVFFKSLPKALKAKPRVFSVDTYVHYLKAHYPGFPCPSTATVYWYIEAGKLPPELHKAETCRQALQDTIDDYGAENFRTITFDNGSEFASLNQVQGTEIYFAHPYSPWERGTNENVNGQLREFFPKGHSFKNLSLVDLQLVQDTLNPRPRRCLSYSCLADVMPQLI